MTFVLHVYCKRGPMSGNVEFSGLGVLGAGYDCWRDQLWGYVI